MVRAMKLRAVPVLAVTAVLSAGCGTSNDVAGTAPTTSSGPTSPAPTSATPRPLPHCAAVWVVGRTLPEGYSGCSTGGQTVAKALRCENGQQLFTYRARYFAVPGGRIFAAKGALSDDPQFRQMQRACSA